MYEVVMPTRALERREVSISRPIQIISQWGDSSELHSRFCWRHLTVIYDCRKPRGECEGINGDTLGLKMRKPLQSTSNNPTSEDLDFISVVIVVGLITCQMVVLLPCAGQDLRERNRIPATKHMG